MRGYLDQNSCTHLYKCRVQGMFARFFLSFVLCFSFLGWGLLFEGVALFLVVLRTDARSGECKIDKPSVHLATSPSPSYFFLTTCPPSLCVECDYLCIRHIVHAEVKGHLALALRQSHSPLSHRGDQVIRPTSFWGFACPCFPSTSRGALRLQIEVLLCLAFV